MSKSQESFSKKEKEKKRLKKRQEKEKKREERKANAGGSGLDDMIVYVDENGNLTDTPPDLSKKEKIDAASIELGVPKREDEETSDRIGIVDFFNHDKGFGFIKEKGSGEKYFVHVKGTLEEINENDKVIFELEQGMKGLNAINVKKI